MDLSLVIPVRDEAPNIEPLMREIRAALDGRWDYEVIFVDDGSSDGTPASLAAARSASGHRVRVYRHRARCGQSAAIWTGVNFARAPWIVTLDGDGQCDPADIGRLLAARDGGWGREAVKMVCGIRRIRRDSALRRASSRIANGVRSRLLGDGVPDTGCGLKLFERTAFLRLPYFDHMHRFLPALMRRQGAAVTCVDVRHRPRLRGRSKYGVHNRLWVGLFDLLGVMWLQRRARLPAVDSIEAARS